MKKLSNDQNIENLKKRKILWFIILIMYFISILIAFISLFVNEWYIIMGSLVFFLTAIYFKNKRENIPINKIDDYVDDRDDIKDIEKEKLKIRKRNKNR